MTSHTTETQLLNATMWILAFLSGTGAIAAAIAMFRLALSNSNTHVASEGCDDEGETPHRWSKWTVTKQGWFNNTQRRVCQRCGEHEQRVVRK